MHEMKLKRDKGDETHASKERRRREEIHRGRNGVPIRASRVRTSEGGRHAPNRSGHASAHKTRDAIVNGGVEATCLRGRDRGFEEPIQTGRKIVLRLYNGDGHKK
jgi:hypothetical protein